MSIGKRTKIVDLNYKNTIDRVWMQAGSFGMRCKWMAPWCDAFEKRFIVSVERLP